MSRTKTTSLQRSPPPSYYLDGMELGTGVDAITGGLARSALDGTFNVKDVTSAGSSDTFSFRSMSDISDLESSDVLGFSSSVTFPADGVKVGAKRSFDFTSTSKSSTSVLLVVLDWERRGQAKRVTDMKLSSAARAALSKNRAGFRDGFGDYFVYQISHMSKFTAVWKCTSENSSELKSFEHEISGSLSASEVEASGSFTTKLSRAASRHSITVEVQYQAVGDAGRTKYDRDDVVRTFNAFRDAAKPVPYEVLLHHYSTVDGSVPQTIKMDPDVFGRVCHAFALARFVLFLVGVVPGTRGARLDRRNKITRLFSEIHAKRAEYQSRPAVLTDALEELKDMRQLLWLRLERQDLVMEMHSITYEDMKRKFAVEHENVRGAWVQSSENQSLYDLGRTGFSHQELKKYAIKRATAVAEVHVGSLLFQQQVGALEFPGTSGINGYVVGLTVESCWRDGTNGWWCIGKELSLGTKQAKVEVKTEGSRGMHWRLHVHYIPCSEYDE